MTTANILFVGNSYTHCNDLPHLVASLARNAGHTVTWQQETPGGWSLEKHAHQPETLEALRAGGWTHVVLQDHSLGPVDHPKAFYKWGAWLVDEVRAVEAQPVFYMTWARAHRPGMQPVLTQTYGELAHRTGSLLAPVGEAWRIARSGDPQLVLHTEDLSHPNPAGSYLAACVFYGRIWAESPVGQIAAILPAAEDRPALELDPELAAYLQRAAENALNADS